ALPPPRSRNVARSAIQHRLSIRRDLPRRTAAGRARTSRPRDRAARKGPSRAARQVGVLAGYRLRSLLVAARLSGSGSVLSTCERRSWCALVAPIACGDDARPRWRPAVIAANVDGGAGERRDRLDPT